MIVIQRKNNVATLFALPGTQYVFIEVSHTDLRVKQILFPNVLIKSKEDNLEDLCR